MTREEYLAEIHWEPYWGTIPEPPAHVIELLKRSDVIGYEPPVCREALCHWYINGVDVTAVVNVLASQSQES